MNSSKIIGICSIVFLAFSSLNLSAQCPVKAYASKMTISCGDPVTLSAVASGCIPLNNNFNGGTIGTWQATTGAVVTNGNGNPNATYNCVGNPPEGANCLWMGATVAGERNVTTQDYNLTACGGGSTNSGSLCFWMKYSSQGGPDPCEGIDLPAEGITIEYSTNNGGTWTTMQYYDPNGGFDPVLTAWNYYCLTIPAVAIGPNTRFRWRQSQNSGAGFDTWGLDDVSIILNGPGYTYDWAHDAQAPSSTSITPDVNPMATTTYTVTYTNGGQTCTSSVTVEVIKPSVVASASPLLVCEGTPVNLNAQSSLAFTPPASCSVNANASCDPLTMIADEKVVGNGNVVQTYNNGNVPIFGNFGSAYTTSHVLYRASELLAAGMTAGRINNISFDIAAILTNGGSLGSVNYNEVKIDMGCTNVNTMTNYSNPSVNFSNVFPPQSVTFNIGLKTFFFANSYNWDGVSNIVLRICWRVPVGESTDAQPAYAMPREGNVGFNALFNSDSNFEDGQCAVSSFTNLGAVRPNTTFGYCKARDIVLNYSWSSNPTGFTSTAKNPSATPGLGTTTYTVSVNNTNSPPGCAVTHSVNVQAYEPTISVNPNPANICPPGTSSVVLNGSGTTNTNLPATRTFTNSTPVAIPDAGGGFAATCGTPGATQSSVIPVTGIVPATLNVNPVFEVAVNMTTANNQDYRIELVSPSGNVIALKLQQTANGVNLTNTRFRATGPAMANGGAPYNNIYGSANAFTGLTGNINGNWTLRVTDFCKPLASGTSTGTLQSWSITFNTENYISTWQWSPAANLTSTNTQNTTASPPTSRVYTLTGTDFTGCSASITVPVNVNTAPTVPVNNESICNGSSATLTATPFDGGGGTYSWSPGGATTQSITVSPTNTTGYTVTYTSGGCAGTGTGTVTVKPTPTVTITNSAPTICSGNSSTLSSTVSQAGGTYNWMPGNFTTPDITVSPTSTTTYTLTYTLNGCIGTRTTTVTVNPSPSVTVNSSTICSGEMTTLTASPSPDATGTYSWSPGGQTSQSISISPASTTTYTVTYTRAGCTATANGTVTVNTTPSVVVNNSTICSGSSATLNTTVTPTPTAGSSYVWSPGGQTTASITVNPTVSTDYSVTYESAAGCIGTATGRVTVNPTPTASISNPSPDICNGSAVTLSSTVSPTGGTYSWAPGGQSIPNITVSPSTSTTYTLTYALNGCSATQTTTVNVNPIPTVNVSSPTICSGATANITSTVSPTGGTYSWAPGGQTTANISVNPSTSTTYTLTYTSLSNCVNSATSTVTVNPGSGVVATDTVICAGASAVLRAIPTTSGGTYLWSPGGQTTQTITVNPGATANFTVSYTLTGCTASDVSSVTVNPLPTVTLADVNICQGSSTVLDPNENPAGGTYLWSPGGQTTHTISVSPGSTTNYSVNYTLNGCSGSASNTVTVAPALSGTISGDATICADETTSLIINFSGVGPYNIVINDGTNDLTINNISDNPYLFNTNSAGTYTLTSVSNSSCVGSASGSATIVVNELVGVSSQTGLCDGFGNYTISFEIFGGDPTSYSVIGMNGGSISPSAPYIFTSDPIDIGTSNYSFEIEDGNNCNLIVMTGNQQCGCVASASISGGGVVCAGTAVPLNFNMTGTGPWDVRYTDGTTIFELLDINTPHTENVLASGTYTIVRVIDDSGCNGSTNGSATVTVNSNPTVSISLSGSNPICLGESVTFTAQPNTNGGSYLWNDGSTQNTLTITPASPGTQNVSVTYNLNNCFANANSSIDVNPVPTVNSNDTTICAGGSANLRAQGVPSGGTYVWQPVNISAPSITVAPSSSSNYEVIYTLNGCSDDKISVVTVQPQPTVSFIPATICEGESATLTATVDIPGGTYSWLPNGETTPSINVTPASGVHNYTVNYTLGNCSSNFSDIVTVNEVPNLVTTNDEICNGETAQLTVSADVPGGAFLWSPGSQTNDTILVNPSFTTDYTVSYVVNNCGNSAIAQVIVNNSATLTVNSETICEGELTRLTATTSTPGGSFLWSPGGETTSFIDVAPGVGTHLYDVSYNLSNCSATATSTVTVNAIPVVSIVNDTICNGEQAFLESVVSIPGGNYLWGPGSYPNNDTLFISPTITNNYTLRYTVNNCFADAVGEIVVNPSPSLVVNNETICNGESADLTSTTSNLGGTYLWTPGGFTTPNITVSPSVTTDYLLEYRLNDCTVSRTSRVTVNNPSPITVNDSIICQGSQARLTATPAVSGGTFIWSPTGLTTSSIDVSPSNTTTYTVQYNLNNCLSDATGTVTVNSVPTVNITTDTVDVCQGNPATLTAVPSLSGGNFVWINPPASGQTSNSITITPSATTEYYVSYTRNNCVAMDSAVVRVNLAPTLSVQNDNICEGEVGTLTAVTNGDASAIVWTPGNVVGPTLSVSPAATTQYTATLTSDKNCTNTATASVIVTNTPTITASNNGPYCEGQTIRLTAQSNPNGLQYDWVGPNGYTASGNNVTRPNSVFQDAGTYQVTVSNNGCTNIAFTDVEIIQPNVTIIDPAGPFCADDNPVNLVVNFGGGTWLGQGISDSDAGTFDPSQAIIGINNIRYNPAPGACQTTGNVQIIVNPLPIVDFSTLTPVGCVPLVTSFVDQSTPSSASVLWNFGNGSTSTQLNSAGTIYPNSGLFSVTLTSTSTEGCINTITKNNFIEVFDNAIANFDFVPNEINNLNPEVKFINNSEYANEYLWIFENGSTTNNENPTFNFGSALGIQSITLIANNPGNCPDTLVRELTINEELIFYIPNTFTPDGDKFNQIFLPIFTTGFDPFNYNMRIFDRWGELLFETNDHTIGWDGTYMNKLVQDGSYGYIVQFKSKNSQDITKKVGSVLIIR